MTPATICGEFMLGDRRYCYPLTITDFSSRYLLTCETLSTTQEKYAFTSFERTFKEFGLPAVAAARRFEREASGSDHDPPGGPGTGRPGKFPSGDSDTPL
jgi:hypothetical protein